MGWQFQFPNGPVLVSAIGPERDHGRLADLALAWVLTRADREGQEWGSTDASASVEWAKRAIREERERNRISPALEGVLRAADTAKTVLVEHGYYDLDSRSEEAISVYRQFRFSPIENDRLHFFDIEIDLEQFQRAFVEAAMQESLVSAYLGYCVLRTANPLGVVGRTMLAPPRQISQLHKPEDFRLRAWTRVTEHLSLAGIPLRVEGVPFMQQEGAVTRCAHVAAWMAHYVGVLRGLIPRAPVAHLYAASSTSKSLFQRQFPSPGLTENQLVDSLMTAGLPPEVQVVQSLEVTDRQAWYHRPGLRHKRAVAWHREAFTTTICRYLNSGLPVLLAQGDHVEVLCGYLRDSHLSHASSQAPTGEVASLISCDDQEGPYVLRSVDALLRDTTSDSLLITPCPAA